ncbi:MAG: biotin synthase BioB [Deltaproteobacteria bacterium]|nr:biotin synthase BioB [Deltaproteobacteria bacterium]
MLQRNTHDLSFRDWISTVCDRVLAGGHATPDEAARMLTAEGADTFDLFAGANRIREAFQGADIHLCSIVNAKSGRCSEDCGFCSQSAHFPSPIPEYKLVDTEEVVRHAEAAKARGSQALGIVAAWKGLKKGKQLDAVLERIEAVAAVEGVNADASLGLIDDPEIPVMLKNAGLVTYNHNLETSRNFFEEVCETHSYDDRVQTLTLLKNAGVHTCSGGIFGMGETRQDRVDLAFELRALDVDVIPMNFLNPMEGTPMADRPLLPPMECLRTVSMFRFVNPTKEIMLAGGREVNLRDLQPLMYVAGASASMAGHYLTSGGRETSSDWRMIRDLEMDYVPPGRARPEGEMDRLAGRLPEPTAANVRRREDGVAAGSLALPVLSAPVK